MKIIIFVTALLISTNSFAQYSSYYKVNVDQNINLNQNVNLSGSVNVNKNIKTIDYGQLALANAQREKKRLDNLRCADEQEKRIYLEIVKANLTEANRYSIFLLSLSFYLLSYWSFQGIKLCSLHSQSLIPKRGTLQ